MNTSSWVRLASIAAIALAGSGCASMLGGAPRMSFAAPERATASGALRIGITELSADRYGTGLRVGLRLENQGAAEATFDPAQLAVVFTRCEVESSGRFIPVDPLADPASWSGPVTVGARGSATGAVLLGVPSGELESASELVWRYGDVELHRLEAPWNRGPAQCACRTLHDPSLADQRPVKRVNPRFPHGSVQARAGGWVGLTFDVDADGHVKDARVTGSYPAGVFDEVALEALRHWEYAPGAPRSDLWTRFSFSTSSRKCPGGKPCPPQDDPEAPYVVLKTREQAAATAPLRIGVLELRTASNWTNLHAGLRIHNASDAPLVFDPSALEVALAGASGELRGRWAGERKPLLVDELEPLTGAVRLEPHQTIVRAAFLATPPGALESAHSLTWIHAGVAGLPMRALWAVPDNGATASITAQAFTPLSPRASIAKKPYAQAFARLLVSLRPDGNVCRTDIGAAYPDEEVGKSAASAIDDKGYPPAPADDELLVLVDVE